MWHCGVTADTIHRAAMNSCFWQSIISKEKVVGWFLPGNFTTSLANTFHLEQWGDALSSLLAHDYGCLI